MVIITVVFKFEVEITVRHCYGHSTGNTFTLGDKVKVRVKSADLRRRMLDFTFVEVDGEPIKEPTITFNDKVKKKRKK